MILVFSWILTLFNLILIIIIILKIYTHIDFLKLGVLTFCVFFSLYVINSSFFFLADLFSIDRVLLTTLFEETIVMFFLHSCSTGLIVYPKKNCLLVVLIITFSLPICVKSFEFFGMGQDQGVYQTKTLELIAGKSDNWLPIKEYEYLKSDDEQKNYRAIVSIGGFYTDNPVRYFPSSLSRFMTSPVNSKTLTGIYHGIPTFPALLALWGKLFSVEHMISIQLVFFMCTLLLVFYTTQNLNFNTPCATLALLICAFSPITHWVTKSSLCEGFLATLMVWFLFHMTEKENAKRCFLAILPIAAFSFFHVSIYTLIPYFIGAFLLFCWSDSARSYAWSTFGISLAFTIGCDFIVKFKTLNG